MFGLPLHPAVVHIPLGIGIIMPLLAVLLAWALWRELLPRNVLAIPALLQVLVACAGLLAVRSGLDDESYVSGIVPEWLLEQHQNAAWMYIVVACFAAVLAFGAFTLFHAPLGRLLTAGFVLLTLLQAGLGMYVGHLGGQLVYLHNAGSAFSNPAVEAGQVPTTETPEEP